MAQVIGAVTRLGEHTGKKSKSKSQYMADSKNDMVMRLMSEAKGVERSLEGWARRLLLVNVIGIHSTALASNDTRCLSVLQAQ
jgi:hypothetical protein